MRSRLVAVSLALALVLAAGWLYAARNDRRGDYQQVAAGAPVVLEQASFRLTGLERVDSVTDSSGTTYRAIAGAVLLRATIAYDATAAAVPAGLLCSMQLVGQGAEVWYPESILFPDGADTGCTAAQRSSFVAHFEIAAWKVGQVRGVGLHVFDTDDSGSSAPEQLLLGGVE